MSYKSFVVLLSIGVALAAVAQKDRVIDKKLSDKEPGSPDYDHEAFLGKKEAHEFDELTPEESRRRLGIIVNKIDKDGNGQVSEDELKDWISYTQKRYIQEDSDKQFDNYDLNKDKKIHWDEYKKTAYGFLENMEEDAEHDTAEYQRMIERDERRFKTADADRDEHCTMEEFRAFLHPEDHDHMKDIVTKETLDDIDKNKDGFIDLEEYIGDMLSHEEGGEEPEWIATEREQFKEHRDMNKDGKLDLDEVRDWIMPDDYNHVEAEAKHLIYEADDNKDGELNKEEFMEHHDKFVNSQVTDWGEALKRHDEF